MKLIKRLRSFLSPSTINRLLQVLGYSLLPVGESYAYSPKKMRKLEKQNIDVNFLIENAAKYETKIGQRDRICERVLANVLTNRIDQILEVGPGTGRFTSKFVEILKPNRYYIIETSKQWRKYLIKKFEGLESTTIVAPIPNGRDFASVDDASIDFVHGHGVFVYLNHVTMHSYLNEIIRVTAPGAFVYLEYFSIQTCTIETLDQWVKSIHWFPIFHSDVIVDNLLFNADFEIIDEWSEMFGESLTRNVLYQKKNQ